MAYKLQEWEVHDLKNKLEAQQRENDQLSAEIRELDKELRELRQEFDAYRTARLHE